MEVFPSIKLPAILILPNDYVSFMFSTSKTEEGWFLFYQLFMFNGDFICCLKDGRIWQEVERIADSRMARVCLSSTNIFTTCLLVT